VRPNPDLRACVFMNEPHPLLLGRRLYSWGLRLKMAKDIAQGLVHMHSKKVVHRDIRSQNLRVRLTRPPMSPLLYALVPNSRLGGGGGLCAGVEQLPG
jgi:serine/threonine protein kinase